MIGPGSLVGKRFEIRRILGEGGAAIVFEAEDRELERPVAVKLLRGRGVLAAPERFLIEARAMARLSHPHIVAILDMGMHDDHPFLVLEYLGGGDLHARIGPRGLAPAEVEAIGDALLQALEYAHGLGVLHRDLKPANVLLTEAGVARLADFGLAKTRRGSVHTRTGLVVGTPEYMAPEVLGGKPASAASDLYSWGCLVYHMTNGRPPHEGSVAEIYQGHSRGVHAQGTEAGGVQAALDAVLVADPAQRPGAADLRDLLAGRRPPPGKVRSRGVATVVRPSDQVPAQHRRTDPDSPPQTLLTDSVSGSAGSGPPGAPGPAPWRRGVLTAMLLLAGALAAGWMTPSGSGPAPGPSPGEVAPAPFSGLLWEWRRRGDGLVPEAILGPLHERVRPRQDLMSVVTDDFFAEAMRDSHRGKEVGVDRSGLREVAAGLPYRKELERDRAALTTLLLDRTVPIQERLELYRSLQNLAMVDAYFEAWNEPPPYRIQPVLDRLFPVRVVDDDPTLEPDLPSPPGYEPGGGRHLLFRWESEDDRRFPYLFAAEARFGALTAGEQLGWRTAVDQSERWEISEHEAIRAEVELPAAPATRYRRCALRFLVANLFYGHVFELTWNGTPIHITPDGERAGRIPWNDTIFPDYQLEVEVPLETMRPGRNSVELQVHPLAGVPRRAGCNVDVLEMVLEERSPAGV